MMDYEAVLAHVLALLQQEQRLSYRVLKRRLHLEDDLLEDLKEDLMRPNAVSSRCYFVTWWTRRCSPASSTRKSGAS
jgi:hypothetical protein